MKCDYCGNEDHLETACIRKSGARGRDLLFGLFFVAVLVPFLAAGCVIGALWGAFIHGWKIAEPLWGKARRALLGWKAGDDADPTL